MTDEWLYTLLTASQTSFGEAFKVKDMVTCASAVGYEVILGLIKVKLPEYFYMYPLLYVCLKLKLWH